MAYSEVISTYDDESADRRSNFLEMNRSLYVAMSPAVLSAVDMLTMLQTETYDTFTVLPDAAQLQAKCKVWGFGVAKKRSSNQCNRTIYTV